MKRTITVLMLCICVLLSGCSISKLEDTSLEGTNGTENTEYPVGALLPILSDENTGSKATKIELEQFTLTLPEGYVYTKIERTLESGGGNAIPYNVYFVWQDKPDKDYVLEYDGDVLLYIFEGKDTNSPHKNISEGQAQFSLNNYENIMTTALTAKNTLKDNGDLPIVTADKETFARTFTANSGQEITTTYGEMIYPKTYYGLCTLDVNNEGATRNFYGFIFSNDTEGEIFKKSEYENLFGQIKSAFNIQEFHYTEAQPPEIHFKTGRTYDELVKDVIYQNKENGILHRGLFYNTLLYYVNTTGRSYERKNVDGYVVPQDVPPSSSSSSSEPTIDS